MGTIDFHLGIRKDILWNPIQLLAEYNQRLHCYSLRKVHSGKILRLRGRRAAVFVCVCVCGYGRSALQPDCRKSHRCEHVSTLRCRWTLSRHRISHIETCTRNRSLQPIDTSRLVPSISPLRETSIQSHPQWLPSTARRTCTMSRVWWR